MGTSTWRASPATIAAAAFPVLALILLAVTWGRKPGPVLVGIVALVLAGAVLSAVHHAEVVAHRVGEPFGSLVLAVAVTVIEVALIITLMISGGEGASSLARDTVFAAVMITLNGIVGISLLTGALKFGETLFNAEGSGAALATVASLAGLSLVLPTFTNSRPGPEFSTGQLAFAAAASLVLYASFVGAQTIRHRDFFLPVTPDGPWVRTPSLAETEVRGTPEAGGSGTPITASDGSVARGAVDPGGSGARGAVDPGSPAADDGEHAPPPTLRATWTSLALLVAALVAVVGLAKVESPAIESAVRAVDFPLSFVGVVIALLVLAPETLAALRAARRNQLQTSLNLALGSAMASIGLTIPAIAVAMLWLDGPLLLGLGSTQTVLLTLTVVVSILTVVPGRATRLQGVVHLVLFGAFVFLSINP
ncbi:ionic transporter y4hA [Longispora sp. NPDC051575]|uniref:calcium:proton antiporter n=1 Tax=Longispora sp. NPDC051575 TaxID=3154943 RepID=UPI00343D2F48